MDQLKKEQEKQYSFSLLVTNNQSIKETVSVSQHIRKEEVSFPLTIEGNKPRSRSRIKTEDEWSLLKV